MEWVGLAVAAAVLVIGVLLGVVRRRRDGRLATSAQRVPPELLASLGVAGQPATLLQFSSEFCAPCRTVRRVSAEIAATVPGVQHVEVDVEDHLDAVRTLGIWRTPTLLLLDADGRVTGRVAGVPTRPDLIAAIGATHGA